MMGNCYIFLTLLLLSAILFYPHLLCGAFVVCFTQDGKKLKHAGLKTAKKLQTSKKSRPAAAVGNRQLSLSSFFKTVKEENSL